MLVEASERSPLSPPFADGAGPSWASEWGQDRYGRYADLEVQGVVQRFRWIAPGSFFMGYNAAQRRLQDKVTLTRGYWLADTTCTQELWLAIMNDNPSHFQGEGLPEWRQMPVESVSWEDCQNFVATLAELKRDARLPLPEGGELHEAWRLPTEAEWEYACRAGTSTNFSFGDEITPEQANIENRRSHPVPVKQAGLACNNWGLYQMHGNVWEWCWDCLGEYPVGHAVNPIRSEQGELRVLRGGSWYSAAQEAHSASCYALPPVNRARTFGFRLARGHKLQAR